MRLRRLRVVRDRLITRLLWNRLIAGDKNELRWIDLRYRASSLYRVDALGGATYEFSPCPGQLRGSHRLREPHVRVPPHTAQVAKALSFALGKRFAVAKLTASLSARAKLRPRLLIASGPLIPSPEIQVRTGKDLLIPRGWAGLEASYLLPISPPSFSWVSLHFLDRLLANAVPPIFWFPLGLPCSQVDPMALRKGDLVLYSGDLFRTETRKLPSCPRSYFVNRKGKPTHLSSPLVDWCGFTKRLSTIHSR
ncbi:hypothetical protein RND71_008086 [Anisodus tanguticus]|uniref:Uncharacterized protein n=1 Tax=Anisodus tanguticus TaxID=243964 RepID=A0AAE1SMS4_9SOLA|nr:hypothetical protein RND71_008086 [Anisodus tanguticus]